MLLLRLLLEKKPQHSMYSKPGTETDEDALGRPLLSYRDLLSLVCLRMDLEWQKVAAVKQVYHSQEQHGTSIHLPSGS